MMAITVVFRKSNGRLIGAQVLAEDLVPQRINAFAMAIRMRATIYDLEEAGLCFATRILREHGFKARDVSGGMLARSHRAQAQR